MCAPCWAVCSQTFEIWYIWRISMIYIQFRPDTCHWSSLDRGSAFSSDLDTYTPGYLLWFVRVHPGCGSGRSSARAKPRDLIGFRLRQGFQITSTKRSESNQRVTWAGGGTQRWTEERNDTELFTVDYYPDDVTPSTGQQKKKRKPLQRGLVFFSRSWSSIWIQGQKNPQNFKNQFWTYPGWGERNLVSHKMALQKPILFFSLFFFFAGTDVSTQKHIKGLTCVTVNTHAVTFIKECFFNSIFNLLSFNLLFWLGVERGLRSGIEVSPHTQW